MLFLLFMGCAASGDPSLPQCKCKTAAGWLECGPLSLKLGFSRTGTCVMCEALSGDVASVSPFPFVATASEVAIRGYPFHVLSAKKLAPLEHPKVLTLALIDAKITDVKNNTFAGFSSLEKLSLDSNRLTNVNATWFTGLKNLLMLILSNNNIRRIEPGSFVHLTALNVLDLENNLLQAVDPSWLLGLNGRMVLILKHNAHELSFGWMLDPLDSPAAFTGVVNPGKSCGVLGSSLSTISIQPPVVVLATGSGSLDPDKPDTNTLEQCRQVWEYGGGIAVPLMGKSTFRLVSMATEITGSEGVGMSFVQTQDTNTLTTTESDTYTIHTNVTHDNTMNITCIYITRDEHTKLFFTVFPVQRQTPTTETCYTTGKNHSSRLAHYSKSTEKEYTSSEPRDYSYVISTTLGPDLEVVQVPSHVIISVVVSAVAVLAMSFLAVLLWKVRAAWLNAKDDMTSDDAHVWTIPPGVTFPGLLRSASLPAACAGKMASDDAVSCKSLPAVLHSIESTYSEIPDDVACAQRPLPGLPHVYSEIPDDAGVVRTASLPARTRKAAPTDAASCKSLPAVLQSIEPTYSQIPDHMAAAQRLLPALPPTYWEIPDYQTAAQRPVPAPQHTYSEIPDDESGPMPFYADADFSLHVISNRRLKRLAFRNQRTTLSERSMATYGSTGQSKGQRNPFYRNASEVEGIRSRRQLSTALVSRLADQGSRHYANVTDAILSRGHDVTVTHIALLTPPNTYWPWEIPGELEGTRASLPLTPPNTYWPWEIPGEETRNTPRRASLPLTPPNTYWPWEIPGEGTCNTPRRASLTLPNTYWPWEIPGEGTRNTPRRASLTLPNTYWPWEIPGEGTRNTPRRASLTLPNTYWPWELPGEGTRNTPRRASLPLTPPNTYWPWEIPGEETRNTPRRASLPLTPPNTYWPWEIPGEGTRNTPRRASLPLTPPNTYWPWEIPGEGTRNTPRRASLTLTPPNTYWPWEIPGEGTRNTPRGASLPLTLPNTYWPWEIPGEGTRNTPRGASLPLTLPNTYWPWEIPGEGTRNTPRRASLPLTPPNTYWPWEIPGEGTRNTPRRASLTLTPPNTYWPWEIPGEGTRNTPRGASLPLTLPNTYWPWEIPGEETRNTPRRASLTLTPPNTYWPWEIPGEGTCNTPRRASLPTVTLPNTYWPWELPGEESRNIPRRASLTPPNTYWPWEILGERTHITQ
ncbi:hypothetical protein Bbelb_438160 [Branchiostoma belcheri]|nr:hypothetical protein Bbelb_438160 [Branchiostoma belcheri]